MPRKKPPNSTLIHDWNIVTTAAAKELLNDEQLLRYSRQIFLPEIDVEGQQRLLNSKVMVLGLGGLGSPISMYLATSGVGQLVVVDPDQVELSNLQRQIVHTSGTLGMEKVDSAKKMLNALNSDVEIVTHNRKLSEAELVGEARDVDVVVDGTDNFDARFAINRACHAAGTPLVSGAVVRMEGQVSVYRFDQPGGPCYNCLYQEVAESPEGQRQQSSWQNCSETGVLGSVAGIIGCIQATEVVKLLLGIGETLGGRLLLLDARTMEWNTVRLKKDPKCGVCGTD
jgi:adenylyltransferase/sulfurtransferase